MNDKLFESIKNIEPEKMVNMIYNENFKLPDNRFDKIVEDYNKDDFDLNKFLTQEDSLTRDIYDKAANGKIVYPLEKDSLSSPKYEGNIGDQRNSYHKENLKEYNLFNRKNIDANSLSEKNIDKSLFIKSFDYDNIAKKYTSISKDLNAFDLKDKPKDLVKTGFSKNKEKLAIYLLAQDAKKLGIDQKNISPFVKALSKKDKMAERGLDKKEKGPISKFLSKDSTIKDEKVINIAKELNKLDRGITSPEKLKIFRENIKKMEKEVDVVKNPVEKEKSDMRAGRFKVLEYDNDEKLISKDINKNKKNKTRASVDSKTYREEFKERKRELREISKNDSNGTYKYQTLLEKLELEHKRKVQNERDNQLRLKYYNESEKRRREILEKLLKLRFKMKIFIGTFPLLPALSILHTRNVSDRIKLAKEQSHSRQQTKKLTSPDKTMDFVR